MSEKTIPESKIVELTNLYQLRWKDPKYLSLMFIRGLFYEYILKRIKWSILTKSRQLNNASQINILEIGVGHGKKLNSLINTFNSTFPNKELKAYGYDPSDEAINASSELLAKPDESTSVNIDSPTLQAWGSSSQQQFLLA